MYSYLLNMMGRLEEARQCVERASLIEPHTVAYFNYQSVCHYLAGDFEAASNTVQEAMRLFPAVLRFYDFMARIHVAQSNWEQAEGIAEDGFKSFGIRPPSMVALLSIARFGMGKKDDGEKLLQELITRSAANEKGVNIYVVYVESFRRNYTIASEWLEKARATNDVDLIWWDVSPMLKEFRQYMSRSTSPDFDAAEKHVTDKLLKEMPNYPYHNMDHIKDVLQASMTIANAEKLEGDDLKLLRLAALYHDAGFIQSAKDHEIYGADMAKYSLPNFGFNEDQVSQIEGMILATKLPQTPKNLLENILCDADLDYLGRDDFYQRGGTLFEEMKSQGVVDNEREWNLVQKTFLESHRYHTNYSKANRESAKQERLQEIIAKLKNRS
jgi:predicted metal-dependent HD superfamily phosphohydrolase